MITSKFSDIVSNRLSKRGFIEHFSHEIIDLLMDSDAEVSLEAMDVVIAAMEKGYFSEEQFENDILPTISRHMIFDQNETCDAKLSKMLGRFIFATPADRFR